METQKMSAFLKELRKERGLTQEQAAEELFVSSKTLSRWETGATIPDLETLLKLAEYYKVDIRELIDGGRGKAEESTQEDPEAQKKSALQAAAEYSRAREKWYERHAVIWILLPVLMVAALYAGLLTYTGVRNAIAERSGERLEGFIGKVTEYFPKEEDGSQKLRIDSDFGEVFVRITPQTEIAGSVKMKLEAQETGAIVRITARYTPKDISRAERKGGTYVYTADGIGGPRSYSEETAGGTQ